MGAPVPRMTAVWHPLPYFKLLEVSQRHAQPWYRVRAYHPDAMRWIRNQDASDWMEEHGRTDRNGYGIDGKRFFMCEKMYLMMTLTWSRNGR